MRLIGASVFGTFGTLVHVGLALQTLQGTTMMSPTAADWARQSERFAKVCCADASARAGDVDGGLLWVEHLNIVVGERSVAERFYFEKGLGCTRDPSKPGGATSPRGTMWANLGAQQFHLAEEGPDDPPQAVRGSIGLAVADAAATAARLRALEGIGVAVEVHENDRFTVRCPWGNVFHCYDADTYRGAAPAARDTKEEDAPKMTKIHSDDAYAGGRISVRGAPGIRYVHFLCADARAAARRYATHFGDRRLVQHQDDDIAAVAAGVGPVHFVFETAAADAKAEGKFHGVHACVYVDDFARRYNELKPFVFTNARFTRLDTCDTLEEALASRTFRFAFPEVPNLEHETRALSHKNFMQHLKYQRP